MVISEAESPWTVGRMNKIYGLFSGRLYGQFRIKSSSLYGLETVILCRHAKAKGSTLISVWVFNLGNSFS